MHDLFEESRVVGLESITEYQAADEGAAFFYHCEQEGIILERDPVAPPVHFFTFSS